MFHTEPHREETQTRQIGSLSFNVPVSSLGNGWWDLRFPKDSLAELQLLLLKGLKSKFRKFGMEPETFWETALSSACGAWFVPGLCFWHRKAVCRSPIFFQPWRNSSSLSVPGLNSSSSIAPSYQTCCWNKSVEITEIWPRQFHLKVEKKLTKNEDLKIHFSVPRIRIEIYSQLQLTLVNLVFTPDPRFEAGTSVFHVNLWSKDASLNGMFANKRIYIFSLTSGPIS